MNIALSFATSETDGFVSLLCKANSLLRETNINSAHKDHSTHFKTMQFNFIYLEWSLLRGCWVGFGFFFYDLFVRPEKSTFLCHVSETKTLI